MLRQSAKCFDLLTGRTYFVDRAIPNFEAFRTQRGGASLFHTFMGDIYKHEVEVAALECVKNGYNSHITFLRSMTMLARCFWMDVPHYFCPFTELYVFKSGPILDNRSKFMEYVEYAQLAIASHHEQSDPSRPSSSNNGKSNELHSIREEIARTKSLASLNQSKLDCLLHFVESGQVAKRQKHVRAKLE